ncbi:MAG TPA: peptide ABC transporter substrate-binding protein [Candidatus Baltobacteraceae bacterium]|jgi:peptide/nickel transport system substrate-binding protein
MSHVLKRTFTAMLSFALLAACSGQTVQQSRSGGETLRIAVSQDAKSLNPILSSNTVDGFIQRFMFEPLLSADPRGNPVPMLAAQVPSRANGGVSGDGRTITYHLRKNARWTDGVPVTAADVRFSWQAIMNPNNNAVSRHGYDDIARIDTPDDRTAVVHLKKPFAPFVNTFFAESDQPYSIVPEHVLAHYPNVNQIPFDARPDVTDGPFRFVEWVHGDRIVMTANDGFFMGKPHLRRIEIHIVPDENTSVNLLRTHAIDYMYQASIATYPALKNIPGIHLVWVGVNGYEGIGMNLRHKPLDDPRVRRAISYAIDKSRLVRTLTYDQEKIATEDLPDWMWAFNPKVRSDPYDPAKARALLHSAGVKTPLNLVMVTETANVTHKREAVLLQAMLRQIGVNVEVKTYPGDLLYAPAGAGGIVNGGSFDIAIWPWYAGIDPDNSSQFTCANIPPHGYNEARYCNHEMEALQNRALTQYDRTARASAYRGIEALLARDRPLVAFWWQRQQEALAVNLKGFAPNPVVESWNAWQWSL